MWKKEKAPTPIYIVPELLENILLKLPLKSILKFKTVSKQWRSVLEAKTFAERRMKVQKKGKILAAYNCDCGDQPCLLPESRLVGDEEIVFLHCDDSRPSLTCDGVVCIPERDCIIVLNPSTGQILRFPFKPDPVSSRHRNGLRNWVMGFGRDKVTGSYKIVKIRVEPLDEECDFIDVESGEWRKLRAPSYMHHVRRKSVYVNGSIYWMLQVSNDFIILALDLHNEEFHNVSVPDTWVSNLTQIVNLEGRLAIAKAKFEPEWVLEICSMNAEEELWTKTCTIRLDGLASKVPQTRGLMWFTLVALSKKGDLVFYNSHKCLLKYYSETGEFQCLSQNVSVISSYIENLVPLWSESRHHPNMEYRRDCKLKSTRCRLFLKHPEIDSMMTRFLKWIRPYILVFVLHTLAYKFVCSRMPWLIEEKNVIDTLLPFEFCLFVFIYICVFGLPS